MTEMNNINNINNMQHIQHINELQQAQNMRDVAQHQENAKTIENLKGHADIVGRSQVRKADNVKEDVNFMLKNPEIMAKAERFFDVAYTQLLREDSPNAYEKAAAMATTFARELSQRP